MWINTIHILRGMSSAVMLPLTQMPSPTRNTLIAVLFSVMVLALATGAYLYFSKPHNPNNPSIPSTIDPFSSLSGKLYLTLSPMDKNRTRLYKYNLSTKELLHIAPLGIFAITPAISPDTTETAMVMYPQTGTATTTLQIFIRNRLNGNSRQVTTSSTVSKRVPDWSPDGTKIAFTAQTASNKSFLTPNDWNVYVTDLSGKETLITSGSYPKWSPDGKKLILLKNDGLYLYNLASTTATAEKKLWGGTIDLSMKIALNASRDTLAWTDASSEKMLIFSVNFTNESITPQKRITTFGFWPVFSPDGKYVVVQEGDNAADLNPRLTAYNLSTGDKKEILDLQAFNPQKMFLTYWSQ